MKITWTITSIASGVTRLTCIIRYSFPFTSWTSCITCMSRRIQKIRISTGNAISRRSTWTSCAWRITVLTCRWRSTISILICITSSYTSFKRCLIISRRVSAWQAIITCCTITSGTCTITILANTSWSIGECPTRTC